MVRLHIRNLADRNASVTLDVDPSTTISELKVLIAEAYQASSDRMELIFRTSKLIDSDTISSSHITDESTVSAYLHSSRPSSSAAGPSHSADVPSSLPAESPISPGGSPPFFSTPTPSFSADELSSFPPPRPPPPSSSTSGVLDIDDPSIPDWVRNPVEMPGIVIRPSDVQQLVEMGYPVRQARNALRLAHGSLQDAASMTDHVQTEADNHTVERIWLVESGLSLAQREDELRQWVRERTAHPMDGGSLFGTRLRTPERRTQRVEPVLSITPADVAPFLGGSNADLPARVRERFPGNSGNVLIEVLELLRNGITETLSEYINPFAILGVSGTIGNQIFGDNLAPAAQLNTEECQWLLTKWRDGKDFGDLCEVLEAAESNLETADQLLRD